MGEQQGRRETADVRTRPGPSRDAGGWAPRRPVGTGAHVIATGRQDYAALEVLRAFLTDEGWRFGFD